MPRSEAELRQACVGPLDRHPLGILRSFVPAWWCQKSCSNNRSASTTRSPETVWHTAARKSFQPEGDGVSGATATEVISGPLGEGEVSSFLRPSAIPIRLGTVGQTYPLVQSVWSNFEDETIWFCTQADSLPTRGLGRNPERRFEVSIAMSQLKVSSWDYRSRMS